MQRVEPAARLIDRFADVVGLFVGLPLFFVGERVVPLGNGHRAAVEPDIAEFVDAAHRAAVRCRPRDFVHIGAVQVQPAQVTAALLRELGYAADTLHVIAAGRVAPPDRDRRSPVTIPAQGPVYIVLQPTPEAPAADVVGHPVNRVIQRHQPVLIVAGANVPCLLRPVDQRRVAAPAKGVGMLVGAGLVEQSPFFQIGGNVGISLLDENAGPRRNLRLELSGGIDRVEDRQVVGLPGRQVVCAKCGRDVNDTGTVSSADIVGGDDVGKALFDRRPKAEQWLIILADQRSALHFSYQFVARLENVLGPFLGQIQMRAGSVSYLKVVDVFTDGQGRVAGKRPRRGRPGQQKSVFFALYGELHVDAGIDGSFLVAQ